MWAVRGNNGMHLTEKLPRNAASFVWTAALGSSSSKRSPQSFYSAVLEERRAIVPSSGISTLWFKLVTHFLAHQRI
nr:hypothetical protein CFP56_72214 [Quercus suber]